MRKIIGVMAIAMLLIVGLVAPASANNHQVRICHATASETNPYTNPNVPKHQIFDEDGHGSDVGTHGGDIIPPFEAGSQGKNPWDAYPGKNWDAEGQAIWGNGCNVPDDDDDDNGENDNGDNGDTDNGDNGDTDNGDNGDTDNGDNGTTTIIERSTTQVTPTRIDSGTGGLLPTTGGAGLLALLLGGLAMAGTGTAALARRRK